MSGTQTQIEIEAPALKYTGKMPYVIFRAHGSVESLPELPEKPKEGDVAIHRLRIESIDPREFFVVRNKRWIETDKPTADKELFATPEIPTLSEKRRKRAKAAKRRNN